VSHKTWFTMKAGEGEAPAEISIHDEIGGWGVTAKDFIAQRRALNPGPLSVSINSPGGSVFDALAIYNDLGQHDGEITVRILGVAASAASLIAMAGDKIKMPENAFMMIHNPSVVAWGNSGDLRDMADVLDKITASIVGVYTSRTGKSAEEVQTLLDAETYMTAQEAKDLGFATDVEPNLPVTASFDLDRLPDNVRATFKAAAPASVGEGAKPANGQKNPDPAIAPNPAAQSTPFAETARVAAVAAGLADFAALFALTAAGDAAKLTATIDSAREIVSLCDVAGLKDRAGGFIRANKPIAEVRAELLAHLTEEDAKTATNTNQPIEGQPGNARPTAASFKTADIWAARNATK
jgi:ATP-dependent Clp protease protease subunit